MYYKHLYIKKSYNIPQNYDDKHKNSKGNLYQSRDSLSTSENQPDFPIDVD